MAPLGVCKCAWIISRLATINVPLSIRCSWLEQRVGLVTKLATLCATHHHKRDQMGAMSRFLGWWQKAREEEWPKEFQPIERLGVVWVHPVAAFVIFYSHRQGRKPLVRLGSFRFFHRHINQILIRVRFLNTVHRFDSHSFRKRFVSTTLVRQSCLFGG